MSDFSVLKNLFLSLLYTLSMICLHWSLSVEGKSNAKYQTPN
jgi:hypothetical protein